MKINVIQISRFVLCVISAILMSATIETSAFCEEKEYKWGAHLDSSAGIGSAQLLEFSNGFIEMFSGECGYSVSLEKYATYDEVTNAFISNDIQLGFFWPEQILKIIDSGSNMLPVSSYFLGDREKRAYCLWHQDSNVGISYSDLQGSTLMTSWWRSTPSYIAVRQLLFDNGIDKPLWQVFDSFVRMENQNSAFMALALGKSDFVLDTDDPDLMLKSINPGLLSKLEHDMCTERTHSRVMAVINPDVMSEDELSSAITCMKTTIENMTELAGKYPVIASVNSYLKLLDARIVPASPKEIDYEIELHRKAQKIGWMDEADLFVKSMNEAVPGESFKIKPDMDYCKMKCGKDSACAVSCLE